MTKRFAWQPGKRNAIDFIKWASTAVGMCVCREGMGANGARTETRPDMSGWISNASGIERLAGRRKRNNV